MDTRWIFLGVMLAGAMAQGVVWLVILARVREHDPRFEAPRGTGSSIRVVLHYDALCRERGQTTSALVVVYWGGLATFVLGALFGILALL